MSHLLIQKPAYEYLSKHFPLSSDFFLRVFAHCIPEENDFEEMLQKKLPCFCYKRYGKKLQLYILCDQTYDAGKYVYEMLSRWIFPGKRLKIPHFFKADFFIFDHSLTAYEIILENEDLDKIEMHLKILKPEICLGLRSIYHGWKILEVKGLTTHEKVSLIQEKLIHWIQKKPEWFDYDLFHEMQHFLITCPDAFKEARSFSHMSRIIAIFYIFKKKLTEKCEKNPGNRHVEICIKQTMLSFPLGAKRVTVLFLSFNFLKDHEVFEKSHLLKSLVSCLPSVKVIDESFIHREYSEMNVHNYYLELEGLNRVEIRYLKEHFVTHLHTHIQQLVHPLFKPRNEEEIMKNIVVLSKELKYMRDLPQVMIHFDEQKDKEVVFTVILARALLPGKLPLKELLQSQKISFFYSIERIKVAGKIRNKYSKEVAVLHVRMPSMPFFREDHSVDLFKARQSLFFKLREVIGEMRDFNGGMLSSQMEMFNRMKEILSPLNKQQTYLLENFFNALLPIEMKTMINPHHLAAFFSFFLEIMLSKKTPMHFRQHEEYCMFFVSKASIALKGKIFQEIQKLTPHFGYVMQVSLRAFENSFFGLLYLEGNVGKQRAFFNVIKTINS